MAEGLLLCGLKLRFEFGGVNMNREEQVKSILLMPIIASKDIKGITWISFLRIHINTF